MSGSQKKRGQVMIERLKKDYGVSCANAKMTARP